MPEQGVAEPIIQQENLVNTRQNQTVVVADSNDVNSSSIDLDFEEFVDGRIRETTKFQSANDLLTNSKPLSFIWKCFVSVFLIFILIGLINGTIAIIFSPILLLTVAIFGFATAFIAGGIIRLRFCSKFFKVIDGYVDPDDLIQFLSKSLKYLQPTIHEWGYMTQGGFIIGTIGAAASKALNEVLICAPYGLKKKRLTNICIRPEPTRPDSGRTQIIFGATNNGVTFYFLDSKFPMHKCLLKTVPITSAAIEYYLKSKGLS
jgi:hypothetical protein